MAAKKPGFAEQNRAKFLQQQKAAKNAGFARTALSFRPGGQPANIAGAKQNLKNIAGEFSGLYGAQRAKKEFSSAVNIAQKKGLGAYGDTDYWKKMGSATGQLALSVPIAGTLIKGASKAGKFVQSATGATARKQAAESAAKAARDKAAKASSDKARAASAAAARKASDDAAAKLRQQGLREDEFGRVVDKLGNPVKGVKPTKPPIPPKLPPKPPVKPPTVLSNARIGLNTAGNTFGKFVANATKKLGVPLIGLGLGYELATAPKEFWEQGYVAPRAPSAATESVQTQPSSTYKVPTFELQYVPGTGTGGGTSTGTGGTPGVQDIPYTGPEGGGGVLNLPYTGPEGGGGVLNLPYTGPEGGSSQPLFQTGVTFNPSALAAGESGAIGAASIASQMANTAPASTFIGNALGETTGMPTTKPGGILGAAQVEGARYLADLASQAQRAAAADAATREQYSQNVMGVRGGAADILGGRAPAILGQGITGARRSYTTGQVANTLSNLSEQEALRRTYGSSLLKAYEKEANQVLTATQARARAAAQIRGQGVA